MRDFILAPVVALLLIAGVVYFVRELWPLLPAWASLLVFIVIAIIIIGHPIYALARWSNRRWPTTQRRQTSKRP